MFELEEEAEKEHRLIGQLLQHKNFDQVYLCGKLFKSALGEIPEAKYFENKTALIENLKNASGFGFHNFSKSFPRDRS